MIAMKTFGIRRLCHACGACTTLCPHGALGKFLTRSYDTVSNRDRFACSKGCSLLRGPCRTVIRKVKALGFEQESAQVLLVPSGNSCPWYGQSEIVRSVLVAEPTAFGLHDLRLASRLSGRSESRRRSGDQEGIGDDVSNAIVRHSIPLSRKCRSTGGRA
jgi:MinD superfamily P-loop ATPase